MPGVFSFLAFFPQLFAVISFIFRDEHLSHKLFLHIHSGSAMSLLEFADVCEDCM